MSEQVSWSVELAVKPGRLAEFRTLTAEMIESARHEPGVLAYERYANEDLSVVQVYERFADSKSAVAHLSEFERRFAGRFEKMVERRRFAVFGSPSSDLRRLLTRFGASCFDRLTCLRADDDAAAIDERASGSELREVTYTPGYTETSVDFMARRTMDSHGRFVIPHLKDGMKVLDCGCGPGTISTDIAEIMPNGRVIAVDADTSQIRRANQLAESRGCHNIQFRVGDAAALEFPDSEFDVVFSHALLEHVGDPQRVVAEFARVIRPGGKLAICSPDWGGYLIAPQTEELLAAIHAYQRLQTANGGDVNVGRRLGELCKNTGLVSVELSARYEVHDSFSQIADYLASQLKSADQGLYADELQSWSQNESTLFAQSWVSCVAMKPKPAVPCDSVADRDLAGTRGDMPRTGRSCPGSGRAGC